MYKGVLNFVRIAMIEKMAKPEEVLLVEDDNGQVIRMIREDTEVTALYKIMKDCLVYLTHLDAESTQHLMMERLKGQSEGQEWDRKKLNTLCWAIGSISGAMSEETEKKLVIFVIKDLLMLVDKKTGKDNKAAIAGNIMYVCGQYPRFLRAHWRFLKTVANKLFEFMHETHPGVQDMACDTFMKLAQKCRRRFVVVNPGDEQSFIETILANLPQTLYALTPLQVASFYQSLGIIISAHSSAIARERLVTRLMELQNQVWRKIVNSARVDIHTLEDQEIQRNLVNVLRINVAVCKSLENNYLGQLKEIYQDMLSFYTLYSDLIKREILTAKPYVMQSTIVKNMRAIKQEILRLMDIFISKCLTPSDIYTMFIPTLLQTILVDYKESVPDARDAQVLSLVCTTTQKMKRIMSNDIAGIFSCVFAETLSMITKNFEDYPEHRLYFFSMIKAIIEFCFESLFSLTSEQFKLVFDSIVWAFKHTERNVSETGLTTLLDLLVKIYNNSQIAQQFYPTYYMAIINDIFFVLTDSLHKTGFKTQTEILCHLFFVASEFPVPLSPNQQGKSNIQFVAESVYQLLVTAFPNKTPSELQSYVSRMMDKSTPDLKVLFRDLVITLKEFSGTDNSELECDTEADKSKKQEEYQQRLQVPGLVKPSDLPEQDDDNKIEDVKYEQMM
jgi:exportin-1